MQKPVEPVSGGESPVRHGPSDLTFVPPLLESKTLPEYRKVRRRIALSLLDEKSVDRDFLIGQLGSGDFVGRRGVLWALENVKEFSSAQGDLLYQNIVRLAADPDVEIRRSTAALLGVFGEKAVSTLEILGRDKEIKVIEAAASSLARAGGNALPVLEAMAGDRRPPVKVAVAKNVRVFGSDALPLLERLAGDTDWSVCEVAGESLGAIGEKALPTLEKLSVVMDKRFSRKAAAVGLGYLGPPALPLLEKLAKDEPIVRDATAVSLGRLGAVGLPTLEVLAVDPEWIVRRSVATGLNPLGTNGLPLLENLAGDSQRPVRSAAAQIIASLGQDAVPLVMKLAKGSFITRETSEEALKQMGDAALPLLRNLTSDPEPKIHQMAARILLRMRYDKKAIFDYAVGLEEPALSSPYLKEAQQRLADLSDISQQLAREYKESYAGLIVLGSTEKGYFIPESDLDFAVMGKSSGIRTRFIMLAEKKLIPVDEESGYFLQAGEVTGKNAHFLFSGMFFGDRGRLREMQRQVLGRMKSEEWDELRTVVIREEMLMDKLSRFNFTPDEIRKVERLRTVLYAPPEFETMKKQLAQT